MPDQYLRTIRHFNRDIHLYLFASGLVGFCLFSGIYSLLFNLYLLRLGYWSRIRRPSQCCRRPSLCPIQPTEQFPRQPLGQSPYNDPRP